MVKYALVVGISQYEDPEITDLQFAARDAEVVGTCLAETCGFDEVRTLTSGGDREPSHVNVVDALHNLAPRLSPDDLFLFYFAGHGIQTGGGAHLLTCNSRIRMPELASVSTGVLSHCLLRIECADRVLILDACRNDPHQGRGDQDNLMTADFSRDIMAVAETPAEGVVPATWVLFSCRPGQRAYEWPDMQHGAFTHYLLEGLQGAAADDRGQITVQALGRYVEEQVPRWARKSQTPRSQTPWGEHKGSWRDIVLAAALAEQPRHGRVEVLNEPVPQGPVLRVDTAPAGATVSVDGQVRGTSPLVLSLRAGEYRLLAELKGYMPVERSIRYDAAGDACFRINLKERARLPEAFFPMTLEQTQEVQRRAAEALGTPVAVTNSIGMKLRLIPGGEFLMGSPLHEEGRTDNEGQHRVRITQPFYLGVYEVTQAEYKRVMGTNPSFFQQLSSVSNQGSEQDTDRYPVERISWKDAVQFCRKLSALSGEHWASREYRLPSEAEWEYACRAGTTTPFHFGRILDGRQANCNGKHPYGRSSEGPNLKHTTPVDAYSANGFGLYDMHGNVWEWCGDWFDDGYYANSPAENPKGPGAGSLRVFRGGSYASGARSCRAAVRNRYTDDYRNNHLGLRVVCCTIERKAAVADAVDAR